MPLAPTHWAGTVLMGPAARCAGSKRGPLRRRLPRHGTTGRGLQGLDLLANVGYRGGVDTLLSALNADRDLFGAEELNELPGEVLLYKAHTAIGSGGVPAVWQVSACRQQTRHSPALRWRYADAFQIVPLI
jgi:hypothetical protein